MQRAVATSELSVGRNRFTFGLLDNNHPLNRPRVRVTFLSLHGQQGTVEQVTTARFNYFARGLKDTDANSAAVEVQGVYAAYPRFRRPGQWGAQVEVPARGGARVVRQVFTVRAQTTTPAVGAPAPRSRNPTVTQLPITKLDSGRPVPDENVSARLGVTGKSALDQEETSSLAHGDRARC